MKACRGRSRPAGVVGVAVALLLVGCSPDDDGADAPGGSSVEVLDADRSVDPSGGLGDAVDRSHRRHVLPAYTASIAPIGHDLRQRIALGRLPRCPVPFADLRHLRVTYVGFDGRAHRGELVVHRTYARAIVRVFEAAYDARWPMRTMRLIDEFGGNDDRSMAANNTSAYNCRRVAGTTHWSAHAYGAALDVNPVQNPYVHDGSIAPPAGRRYASFDRSSGARVRPGVIHEGDVMVRAFARIGWQWGGDWPEPDYQHFYAPDLP